MLTAKKAIIILISINIIIKSNYNINNDLLIGIYHDKFVVFLIEAEKLFSIYFFILSLMVYFWNYFAICNSHGNFFHGINVCILGNIATIKCSHCEKALFAECISSHEEKCLEKLIQCLTCSELVRLRKWFVHECQAATPKGIIIHLCLSKWNVFILLS